MLSLLGMMILIAGTFAANAAENHRADTLNPDLAFHFTCSDDAEPPDEKIERFLQERGFRTLNKVRLAREQHVAFPYTLSIVALDAQQREVTFVGFAHAPHRYSAVLNSPPPTHHDTAFEDALTVFVADQLRCEVRQVSRGENSTEAGPFYDGIFKRAEGWFKQAEEMKQPRP